MTIAAGEEHWCGSVLEEKAHREQGWRAGLGANASANGEKDDNSR